jgi:hypothetical protein
MLLRRSISKDLIPDHLLQPYHVDFHQKFFDFFTDKLVIFFLVWVIWLIIGTSFYANVTEMDLGWRRGFYMAVNIGYSIGWGDIAEPSDDIRIFSTFYVIIGASFVGVALGFFADSIVDNCNDWYVNAKNSKKLEKDMNEASTFGAIIIYTKANFSTVRPILWVLFVFIGAIFSMNTQGWSFIQGLYFSVSSMSTGGHWPLKGGTDNEYFFIGVFSSLPICFFGMPN